MTALPVGINLTDSYAGRFSLTYVGFNDKNRACEIFPRHSVVLLLASVATADKEFIVKELEQEVPGTWPCSSMTGTMQNI